MTIRTASVPDSTHVRLKCLTCNCETVVDPEKVDVDEETRRHRATCPAKRKATKPIKKETTP